MLLSWLSQDGPQSEKHRGWRHPIVAFLVHYSVVAASMIAVHDAMISVWKNSNNNNNNSNNNNEVSECRNTHLRQRQKTVATSLSVYFCLFFVWRLALLRRQKMLFVEFYRQTFLCSVTIFCSSMAFFTGRSLIAEAFCIAVGIDQLLW
jgi:hypothetical protein